MMFVTLVLGTFLTTPAQACGGFFCNGGGTTTTTTTSTETGSYEVPVEQNSERILFQVNPNDTVTTFVEVGYQQNSEVDFAWIIPIPAPIDPADVGTLNAEFFNELEKLTAPVFTFRWTETNYNYNTYSGSYGSYGSGGGGTSSPGCQLGCGGADSGKSWDSASQSTAATSLGSTVFEETYGVDVVAEAVVGPFDIQVITAIDAQDFADWLSLNGYDMPPDGVAALQPYVDGEMAYLGVKLAPDVPDGPIDTLVFTYPATQPMIPLILTSVASADDLPIIAYVLGDEPWSPQNWAVTNDFVLDTRPDGMGGTTYLGLLAEEIDQADGHAFRLEFAGRTTDMQTDIPALAQILTSRPSLTRWRGDVSPDQMTLDPVFMANASLPLYSNQHNIELDYSQGETPSMGPRSVDVEFEPSAVVTSRQGQGAWLLLPLPLFLMRRRRRS